MENQLISIGEAASQIGVSIDTLRRWEKEGILTSFRPSPASKRYYRRKDIDKFLEKAQQNPKEENLIELAKQWVLNEPKDPPAAFYCQTSDIFYARLQSLEITLSKHKDIKKIIPLIIAITGEIGNNSYNHNIGNWPDVPGIFFGQDLKQKFVVLADRGQGVLKSLKRVKPSLKDHGQALRTAFTEYISGRAPENRGNGLKFVKDIVLGNAFHLEFYSGNAKVEMGSSMTIKKLGTIYKGSLAIIKY